MKYHKNYKVLKIEKDKKDRNLKKNKNNFHIENENKN